MPDAEDGTRLKYEINIENAGSVHIGDVFNQEPSGDSNRRRQLEIIGDMTSVTLHRIQDSIADIHVPRKELEDHTVDLLNGGQIVILAGEPGSGKSALAARVLEVLCPDGITFAFRQDSLARLSSLCLPYPMTASGLRSLGAPFQRNLILVESAERFLESGDVERETLRHFLAVIGEDPNWTGLVTCRTFAVEVFRAAFLDGKKVGVVTVPDFSDEELDAVSEGIPALSAPLGMHRLRGLLRRPFYLRLAARLDWKNSAPEDLGAFRKKVWSEIVRCDEQQRQGMPMRRHDTFSAIALGRARTLQPYYDGSSLDSEALHALRRDGLVDVSRDCETALAPSHDVLEDWAILEWIQSGFVASGQDPRTLSETMGTYPAVRRAFRVWLGERLESSFADTASWVRDILTEETLPPHFVDDAVSAALLASASGDFVSAVVGHPGLDKSRTLRRLMHLTRVACRRMPDAAREPLLVGRRILLPEGRAWGSLATFLVSPAYELQLVDVGMVLGFLEDWVLGVSEAVPYPPGAHEIARIALRVADLASGLPYGEREEIEKRATRVALRFPKPVEKDLERRVHEAIRSDHESPLQELVLGLADGAAVARDLPELTVKCTEHAFGMTQEPKERARRSRWQDGPQDVDEVFGLLLHREMFGFPPSALHGPFALLFLYHPRIALDLILRIVNHSCERYARTPSQIIEPPGQITLTLPDGTTRTQWVNGRLWGLYRSATVGPYPVQCALMSLETQLLAWADAKDPNLERLLLNLLARSNNAAVTAVVMSVIQAWPEGTLNALLSLASHPVIFDLDRSRWMADQGGAGRTFEDSMGRTAEENLFAQERREANARAHRKLDLDRTLLHLQTTPAHAKVWALLDTLNSSLPVPSARTDQEKSWSWILHRMDLRKYEAVRESENSPLMLQPVAPAAEVGEMLEEMRSSMKPLSKQLTIQTWARSVFEKRSESTCDPGLWRDRLSELQRLKPQESAGEILAYMGPVQPFVAAVCARDHWEELSETDRAWCLDAICKSVTESADGEISLGGQTMSLLDASIASAVVIPSLVAKVRDEPGRSRLINALSCGVLHGSKPGIVEATMTGVGKDLWTSDRKLALSCLKALLAFYSETGGIRRGWTWKKEQEIRIRQRSVINRGEPFDDARDVLRGLDYSSRPHIGLVKPLMSALAHQPGDDHTLAFLERISELLANSWVRDRRRPDRTEDYDGLRGQRGYEITTSLARLILQLPPSDALRVTAPIRAAMKDAVTGVAEFLRTVILEQDHLDQEVGFVPLWSAFSTAYVQSGCTHPHAEKDLVRALFFGVSWKPDAREWRPLKGHESKVLALFRELKPSEELVEAFLMFLCSIGSSLVPEALPDVASKLTAGEGPGARLTRLAIDRLETMLTPLVHGGDSRVRSVKRLREGTLTLLDAMIEGGSPYAYRMRDDFLTPLAAR